MFRASNLIRTMYVGNHRKSGRPWKGYVGSYTHSPKCRESVRVSYTRTETGLSVYVSRSGSRKKSTQRGYVVSNPGQDS